MTNEIRAFFQVNNKIFEKASDHSNNKEYIRFYDKEICTVVNLIVYSKGILYFPYAKEFIFCIMGKDKVGFFVTVSDKLKDLGCIDYDNIDTDIDTCIFNFARFLIHKEEWFNFIYTKPKHQVSTLQSNYNPENLEKLLKEIEKERQGWKAEITHNTNT